MKTTTLSGVGNYSNKKTEDGNPGYADNTNDAQYYELSLVLLVLDFGRIPGVLLTLQTILLLFVSVHQVVHSSTLIHLRIETKNRRSILGKQGAPDLSLEGALIEVKTLMVSSLHLWSLCTRLMAVKVVRHFRSDTFRVLGQDFTGEQEVHQAFALDGPLFGGRPQSTSTLSLIRLMTTGI